MTFEGQKVYIRQKFFCFFLDGNYNLTKTVWMEFK